MTKKGLLISVGSATIIIYKGEVCRKTDRTVSFYPFFGKHPLFVVVRFAGSVFKETGKTKKTKQEVKDQ